MPEGSYTTYLFEEGVDKILKKVGEEAAEVIIAAKNRRSMMNLHLNPLIYFITYLSYFKNKNCHLKMC